MHLKKIVIALAIGIGLVAAIGLVQSYFVLRQADEELSPVATPDWAQAMARDLMRHTATPDFSEGEARGQLSSRDWAVAFSLPGERLSTAEAERAVTHRCSVELDATNRTLLLFAVNTTGGPVEDWHPEPEPLSRIASDFAREFFPYLGPDPDRHRVGMVHKREGRVVFHYEVCEGDAVVASAHVTVRGRDRVVVGASGVHRPLTEDEIGLDRARELVQRRMWSLPTAGVDEAEITQVERSVSIAHPFPVYRATIGAPARGGGVQVDARVTVTLNALTGEELGVGVIRPETEPGGANGGRG